MFLGVKVLVLALMMLWGLDARAVLVIEICTGTSEVPNTSGDCSSQQNVFETTGTIVNTFTDAVQVRDTGSGKIVRVPISPSKPWPTPANWSSASSGSVNPIPPSTSVVGSVYAGGDADAENGFRFAGFSPYTDFPSRSSATLAGLASAVTVDYNTAWQQYGADSGAELVSSSATLLVIRTRINGSAWTSHDVSITAGGCPDGYVLSLDSSVCELSDSSLVVKPPDSIMNVQRDGTLWHLDDNDSDAGTISGDLNVGVSGSDITIGDPDSGGLLIVHLDSTGAASILSYKVCAGGLCYDAITGSYPSSGVGSSTVTGNTYGTAAGSSGLPSIGGFGGGPGGAWGGSGSGTTVNTCGLPGQAACKIDETETTDLHGAEGKGTAVVSQLNSMKGQADAAASSKDASAFGIPKYDAPTDDSSKVGQPFVGSADCTNPTTTWRGESLPMPICTVTQPLKTILEWALSVMAALYAWFRFTRSSGEIA